MANPLSNILGQIPVMRLFRFGFVGTASNLLGYLAYLTLTYIGLSPKIAVSILYLICGTLSFWGNRQLTFKDKGKVLGSSIRFIITHIAGYAFNMVILLVFVDSLGYTHYKVQAFAIIFVAIFIYFAFNKFVFIDYEDRNYKI